MEYLGLRDVLVQVPGLADPEGGLHGYPGWLPLVLAFPEIPEFVCARKGKLWWSAARSRPGRQLPGDLLVRFASLKRPEQVEKFAEQYGPMGLCRHGYLRTQGSLWAVRLALGGKKHKAPEDGWYWSCCPVPFLVRSPRGWLVGEDIGSWLDHARWLEEVVRQWARWRLAGRDPDTSEVTRGPRPEHVPLGVVASVRLPTRVCVLPGVWDQPGVRALFLAAWKWAWPAFLTLTGLTMSADHVYVSPQLLQLAADDMLQLSFPDRALVGTLGLSKLLREHGLHGLEVGFWPALAVQLVSLVSGYRPVRLVPCSYCGALYTPRRLPRDGEPSYCPQCRDSGVPSTLRSRRHRARKRVPP